MARSARYFLSRLIKIGTLDSDKVLEALRKSVSIESRDFAWAVVDVSEGQIVEAGKTYPYLVGNLVKFDPDAMVEVVDEGIRRTRLQSEPNMQKAASQFVYLPSEAIFGHRHIWNEIKSTDFRTNIASVIVQYYQGFFAECELQPLTDLSRFLSRLSQLNHIDELKARVSPPNPLFSMFWQDLKDYLEKRRLRRMMLKETAKSDDGIATSAPQIARQIEDGTIDDTKPAAIGDAAILMAADGYGTAEITGRRDGQKVIVKTSENAIQLTVAVDITPPELASVVVREVVRLNNMRKLKH